MSASVSIGLCRDRHAFPEEVEKCIYGEIKNPMDIKGLERRADELFKSLKVQNTDLKEVSLYVTGLSTALCAAINAAKKNKIKLILNHYNIATRGYVQQKMR